MFNSRFVTENWDFMRNKVTTLKELITFSIIFTLVFKITEIAVRVASYELSFILIKQSLSNFNHFNNIFNLLSSNILKYRSYYT